MTFADYVPVVLSRTPLWVWVVLVLLIVLGLRRLKEKRTPLALAALAPIGFTIWSLTGVATTARDGDAALVLAAWAAAFVLGASSILLHRGPRPVHQGGGVFLFSASIVPLIVYLLIFWTRYGLGVWAAFEPALASRLTLAAIIGRHSRPLLGRVRAPARRMAPRARPGLAVTRLSICRLRAYLGRCGPGAV